MWIEVDLSISYPEQDEVTNWKALINSRHIVAISPNYFADKFYIEFETIKARVELKTFTQKITNAIYNCFLIALQGSPVAFEEWGSIKPLLNHQVEAIHRRMLYQETLASLSNCEGIR